MDVDLVNKNIGKVQLEIVIESYHSQVPFLVEDCGEVGVRHDDVDSSATCWSTAVVLAGAGRQGGYGFLCRVQKYCILSNAPPSRVPCDRW